MAKFAAVTAVASLTLLVSSATDAQKLKMEDVMKPYEAKPQSASPAPAAPRTEEPARRTRAEEERLITWAREAIMSTMKDPASTQFQALQVKANAVCGLVNARNSYGGYVGYTPFAVALTSRQVFVLPQLGNAGYRDANNSIKIYCGH